MFGIDWESVYFAGLTAGLPIAVAGYFLNERWKRREQRLQYLAEAKRTAYLDLISSLQKVSAYLAAGQLAVHNLNSDQDVDTKFRIYCLVAGLGEVSLVSQEKVVPVLASQSKEQMTVLINDQIFAIAHKSMEASSKFKRDLFHAEFFVRNAEVMVPAEKAETLIQALARMAVMGDTNLGVLENLTKEIEQAISETERALVADFRAEFGASLGKP